MKNTNRNDWVATEYEENGRYGILLQASLDGNLCTVNVEYESPIQAVMKCNVVGFDASGVRSIRYFYKRRWIGLEAKDFDVQMGERVNYKQAELELIATEKDLS